MHSLSCRMHIPLRYKSVAHSPNAMFQFNHFTAFCRGQSRPTDSKMAIFLVQFSLLNASLCLHLCCPAHCDSGLTASIFLECFKQALLTPEDKKTWLQPSNYDCYCTISNPLVASQENGCSFPNRFYLFIYLRKLQSYFKYISICNKFFREYIQNVLEDFMETGWGEGLRKLLETIWIEFITPRTYFL